MRSVPHRKERYSLMTSQRNYRKIFLRRYRYRRSATPSPQGPYGWQHGFASHAGSWLRSRTIGLAQRGCGNGAPAPSLVFWVYATVLEGVLRFPWVDDGDASGLEGRRVARGHHHPVAYRRCGAISVSRAESQARRPRLRHELGIGLRGR